MDALRTCLRLITFLLIGLFVYVVATSGHAQIPERAYQYQRDAIRIWTDVCRDIPIALLAGQIHQESAWRYDARSPYAHGLAQFTTPTAGDMAKWYEELRPADTGDPRWSLRAQAHYMCRLANVFGGTDEPVLFGLSGYNGGSRWTNRDINQCVRTRTCDPDKWAGNVSATPDTRRARQNITENRQYVWRIVTRNQHFYKSWGATLPDPWAQ